MSIAKIMARLRLVGLFVSLFSAGFALQVAAADKTIRITNGEWEPYLSQYAYEYGFASHVVSEAFLLEGIKVKWGFYPWLRAYNKAEAGEEWDASAVWGRRAKTEKSFFISDPVIQTSLVFFYLKERKFEWSTMKDLRGLKVGITTGYEYGEAFSQASKNNVFMVDDGMTDEQNFRKLIRGRIDLFPNDAVVGKAQIRNSLTEAQRLLVTQHPTEFYKTTLHLIISRKSADGAFYQEKFNSGLQKLKASGRFEQMEQDMKRGLYNKQREVWKPTTPL